MCQDEAGEVVYACIGAVHALDKNGKPSTLYIHAFKGRSFLFRPFSKKERYVCTCIIHSAYTGQQAYIHTYTRHPCLEAKALGGSEHRSHLRRLGHDVGHDSTFQGLPRLIGIIQQLYVIFLQWIGASEPLAPFGSWCWSWFYSPWNVRAAEAYRNYTAIICVYFYVAKQTVNRRLETYPNPKNKIANASIVDQKQAHNRRLTTPKQNAVATRSLPAISVLNCNHHLGFDCSRLIAGNHGMTMVMRVLCSPQINLRTCTCWCTTLEFP